MKKSVISEEHMRKIHNISQAKVFLGREFLTWLWYLTEANNKLEIKLAGSKAVKFIEIWIDDRILLESATGTSHENLIKGGSPSQSREATAALHEGKSVKEMKIGIRVDGVGDFITTLDSNHLSPKSLIVPEPKEDEEQTAHPLQVRLQNTSLFVNILDELFLMFMEERTKKNWEQQGALNIAKWMYNRTKEVGALVH